MDCSSRSAFTGAFLPENDSARVSTVNPSSKGSGLISGRTSSGESTSHSLPNFRPSWNRISRPSSSGKKWRVSGSDSWHLCCTRSLPVIPRWIINTAGEAPESGNIKYFPLRCTSWIVRFFNPSASSRADGFFTVLAQVMLEPVMVQPGSPNRIRFRRVFSTSGSSGMLCKSSWQVTNSQLNIDIL